MSVDLSILENMFGAVRPEVQRRLEAILRDVNGDTWDDAHCIILDGSGTLWQYVCYLDPTFPRSARHDEDYKTIWERLPTKKQLLEALELAQEKIKSGYRLSAGEFRKVARW